MNKRVNKVFIGKNVSRDAQVIDGADIVTMMASTGMAEGEIVVLDKNKKVMAAGSTISDSDTIYLAEGTGETFNYSGPTGVAVTSARRIEISDPINGNSVVSYEGSSYSAKSEQTVAIVLAATLFTVGTEYIIRIIYKDVQEHPGQFTHTYRYIPTVTTVDTVGTAIAALITAHSGRRVSAAYTTGTNTLLLTGLPIPESTTATSDIDEFTMVEFDTVFNYVTSAGNWATWTVTSTTTTAASYGVGTWEQVRDLEKHALSYKGLTNRIKFPVVEPDRRASSSATYDMVSIEYDAPYTSPDNKNPSYAPQLLQLCLYVDSGQTTNILAALNPWMASLPGAFPTVSV